jgi:hypothetical protein
MAITRKPIEEPVAESNPAAYEAYLRKGGSAAQTQEGRAKDVRFTLQIPGPLCQQLDELRRQSPVNTSRHHWVLEAIAQRIQREVEGTL